MCQNENIIIPEGLEVNSKNYKKYAEPFIVEIKVNFINYKTETLKLITQILISKDQWLFECIC